MRRVEHTYSIDQDWTFRQQFISCGKKKCRTCGGKNRTHGPYWYAEWKSGGKTRTRYIGKKLPPEIRDIIAAQPWRLAEAAAAAQHELARDEGDA